MKPDTLIILTPGFAENEADSTCLPSLQSFVKRLRKDHPALNIIILALQYPFVAGEYYWHHCRVIALGGKGKAKLSRLFVWMKAGNKLSKLRKEENVVGILSFWCGEAALLGHRFGKKYGVKHYCWILGQDAKKENKYVRRIRPAAAELIAISDFIQQEFEKNHGISPGQVIPLGIDPDEFPKEGQPGEIDIMGAGSLIPLKQYDVFIEVLSKIREQNPQIKAILCGKGPEEKQLKELVEKYELKKNIIMGGGLPHKAVLKYMKSSRIFLHTSNYEGFSTVCLEALYAGMQVISFCKAMNAGIPHWHIVQTKEDMIKRALDLLKRPLQRSEPVLPYAMEKTVQELMQLFNH